MFQLNLKNFRSFKNQSFTFSKINILIGENSSGKSSLLKLFLALKQSLTFPNSKDINFAFAGEFTDLGSYKDAIYYNDTSLPFEFSFTLYEDYLEYFYEFLNHDEINENVQNYFNDFFDKPPKGSTEVTYKITSELDKRENITINLKNDSVGLLEIKHNPTSNEENTVRFSEPKCEIFFKPSHSNELIHLSNIEYIKEGFTSLITGSSLKSHLKKFYDVESNPKNEILADSTFHRIAFLLIAQNSIIEKIDNFDYINPIKTSPSRFYLHRDIKQQQSIADIEDLVDFFSRKSETSKVAFKDFVMLLRKFGIVDDLEIITSKDLPVRELKVKVKDLFSNITDVGYGVSLIMPILLKSLLSEIIIKREGSILLIEQPEVHLHPKLHSQLIEAIVDLSNSTSYFIETHSEHIIRKLQVLVKNKHNNIEPKDISIHYLKREKKRTLVSSHSIDTEGRLNPTFPSGFFDNSYLLSKELLD